MASEKISAMPAASALVGPERIPVVQGGVNKQSNPNDLRTFLTRLLSADNLFYFDGTDFVPITSATMVTASKPRFLDLEIGNTLRYQSGTFQVDNTGNLATFILRNLTNSFVADDSGDVTAHSISVGGGNATIPNSGDMTAHALSVGGGSATITNGGVITGMEVHAVNGFNGTGVFTTFTIVDGIITSAS